MRKHPYASAGIGLGGAVAVWLVWTGGMRPSLPSTAPSGNAPTPGSWSELSQDRIWLNPEWRYRAVVSLPWYVPSGLATPAKAKAYAEDKGFRDVVVSATLPPGWPPTKGDLYVEATWGKAGQYYDRPGALERVWVQI